MEKQLENKHPLTIRWLHWVNFPLLGMMIYSGMLIYWANSVYSIRIFGYEVFHFFPAWFYDISTVDFWGHTIPEYLPAWTYAWAVIPYHLADGLQLHFFFMWFFAVNGVIYILYTIFSGEWRALLPIPGSLKRAPLVALHDAHIVKQPPPQGKYNDAQRIAYTSVIAMGAGSIITGLAIYKPTQLGWLTSLLGGYEWARWEHFWLMILFVLFFAVHVFQVVMAGWGNFRSMITGYDVIDSVEPEPEPIAAVEEAATA